LRTCKSGSFAGMEHDLIETLELDNLLGQAVATMHSRRIARRARRSGREDFPNRDDRIG